jgi:hypothetical protein
MCSRVSSDLSESHRSFTTSDVCLALHRFASHGGDFYFYRVWWQWMRRILHDLCVDPDGRDVFISRSYVQRPVQETQQLVTLQKEGLLMSSEYCGIVVTTALGEVGFFGGRKKMMKVQDDEYGGDDERDPV